MKSHWRHHEIKADVSYISLIQILNSAGWTGKKMSDWRGKKTEITRLKTLKFTNTAEKKTREISLCVCLGNIYGVYGASLECDSKRE